jgi:hypothetical protein
LSIDHINARKVDQNGTNALSALTNEVATKNSVASGGTRLVDSIFSSYQEHTTWRTSQEVAAKLKTAPDQTTG